jgi:hypothetical protein
MKNVKRKIDFYFRNEGSLILLLPQTDNAIEFVENNISLDDWQSKNSIAIEPRYFDDIIEGILNADLIIKMI